VPLDLVVAGASEIVLGGGAELGGDVVDLLASTVIGALAVVPYCGTGRAGLAWR
jgi:hypothetical protein